MRAGLQSLPTDAMLPPRSDGFGSGVMQELVPDEQRAFCAAVKLPRFPLTYVKDPFPRAGRVVRSPARLRAAERGGRGRVARLAGRWE